MYIYDYTRKFICMNIHAVAVPRDRYTYDMIFIR